MVVGWWRVPWSFRVWRGKDTPSPALLGLKLVKGLPQVLIKRYQVMILVDTAFGTVDFLHGIRKLYLTGDKPPNSHSKLSCRN
jgi:hypothetical protein